MRATRKIEKLRRPIKIVLATSLLSTGHSRPVRRRYGGANWSPAKPIADALHQWLAQQRQIDYSLKRWEALTRYIANGDSPIDNNWVENQIRPIAIGRNNESE